jgi:hypothetical protein
VLSGEKILAEHCQMELNKDSAVTLLPVEGADVYVNGELATGKTPIKHGDRLIFGDHHVFRFVNPTEVVTSRRESGEALDWAAAQRELVMRQAKAELSVDKEKHAETQSRMEELERKMAAEKEETDKLLARQRDEFERKMAELAAKAAADAEAARIKQEEEAEIRLAAKLAEDAASRPGTPTADGSGPMSELAYTKRQRLVALKALSKWKWFRCTSLQAEMLSATPILKEANAICETLQKNVIFQFILRSGNVYFPNDSRETQVMVELRNRTSLDVIAVWKLQKLRDRIFDMREFYHSQSSGVDPFSDRPPWFRLIGRSFITLKSLLYETPLEHELQVVNEAAVRVGKLRINIMPGG